MSLSPMLWRIFVLALALLAIAQLTIEVIGAPRQLTLGTRGEALFEGRVVREAGPTTFIVDALPAHSPLWAEGVLPGDQLRFQRPLQQAIKWAAGEKLTLTAIRGASLRRVDVTVVAATQLPPFAVADYVVVTTARVMALVIGLLVGWRRPELCAFRALAATALMAPVVFPFSAPEALHLPWLDMLGRIASAVGLGVLVFFALNYPDDRPTGWRARLRRFYPPVFGLQLAAAVYFYVGLHRGAFEPISWWLLRVFEVINPALFFIGIVLAWRGARGETRVRLQWIVATVGTIVAAFVVGNVNRWLGQPLQPEKLDLITDLVFVAAHIGLMYAIFRHRIFDLQLAANRALIFAIVGAILFGAIQLVHAIASDFLRVDDHNKAALLSAVLALAVYLSFNQLKKLVETMVDRLIFHSWAEREAQLRRFVQQAGLATDAAALNGLFVAAMARFTGGAGCALFHCQADGHYACTLSTLPGQPDRIDANDEIVLALRAHGEATTPTAATGASALALPMLHRGQLLGFALLGAAPNALPYRPDQIAALQSAAHQIGINYHAMRIEALEQLVAAERQTSATLRAQLATALSLARNADTHPHQR
jgi:hypothetical protein